MTPGLYPVDQIETGFSKDRIIHIKVVIERAEDGYDAYPLGTRGVVVSQEARSSALRCSTRAFFSAGMSSSASSVSQPSMKNGTPTMVS